MADLNSCSFSSTLFLYIVCQLTDRGLLCDWPEDLLFFFLVVYIRQYCCWVSSYQMLGPIHEYSIMREFIFTSISTESIVLIIYKTIDVRMDGWMLPQDPTSYHSANSQALDTTLDTELKVQLHYLLAVWLGANYLTSLNLIFLISKWDTVKRLMVLGEDYIWEGCKSLAQCLECFFPTALVSFLWHVSLV